MEGRRSSDQKFCFGFPSEFVGNVFPRDNEVVSHAQFLRRKNTSLGIWKQNTPDNVVSKLVADNICAIWNKTETETLAWSLPLWWEIYTKKPTITITKPIYHYKVKEKGGTCRVLGCDGTGVNTGIHNGDEWKLLDYELKSGALRVIQLELGVECQQIVCQLHLNELFLRHRQVSFLLFGQS